MTSAQRKLLRAALVIEKTPSIWVWLEQHDPKALKQLEDAICDVRREMETEAMAGPVDPDFRTILEHFENADVVEAEQEEDLARQRVVDWDRDHEDGDRADRAYDERED